MDSKELRNLHEAYMDVYAPQENIEEGLRSAVKRLLGGGKKEAEAPKPESRGAELRRRYNVGPEKSDTSAKRQILDRSRAKAEKDEKDYGDKPFQKQVAQKSKAAHDRYLKAGYSKYGADDATPSWNRSKKADSVGREMDAHTGVGGKINKALSPGLGNRPGAGPRVAYGEPNTDRHQGARYRRGQPSTKD